MWNKLSQVASQAKSIAKNVAQEAFETVEELRSVHQEDWNRRPNEEATEAVDPVVPGYVSSATYAPAPPLMLPVPIGTTLPSTTAAPSSKPAGDVTARLQALKAKLQADKAKIVRTTSTASHNEGGCQPTTPGLSPEANIGDISAQPGVLPSSSGSGQPSLVTAYAPVRTVTQTAHPAPSWLPTKPTVFQPAPLSPSPPTSVKSPQSVKLNGSEQPWLVYSAQQQQDAPLSPAIAAPGPPTAQAPTWSSAAAPPVWTPATLGPASPVQPDPMSLEETAMTLATDAEPRTAAEEHSPPPQRSQMASPTKLVPPGAHSSTLPPKWQLSGSSSSPSPAKPSSQQSHASEPLPSFQPHHMFAEQQTQPYEANEVLLPQQSLQESNPQEPQMELAAQEAQITILKDQLAEKAALVATLQVQLEAECGQHGATQSNLAQTLARLGEVTRARETEVATLAEVGEQLARLKEAEAQLKEEQRLHERTRQQLTQLQELQHGSDDRSQQMSEALMELQSQLEEERDQHLVTRDALRAAQKEQQKLQALGEQAEHAQQTLEAERQALRQAQEQVQALQREMAAGVGASHQAQRLQQQLEEEREEHSRTQEQLRGLQREYQGLFAAAQRAEQAEQQLAEKRGALVQTQEQLQALQQEYEGLLEAAQEAKQAQALLAEERDRREHAEERAAELEERLAVAEERLESDAASHAAAHQELSHRDAIWQQELMQQQAAYQQLLEAHEVLQQQQHTAAGSAADSGQAAELARLERELQTAWDALISEKTMTAALQEEVSALHVQLESAQAAALAAATQSSAEDVEAELAVSECARLRLELERVRAEKAAEPHSSEAIGDYEGRLSELQAALDAAHAERAAAKQQLARLKQQMLTEQDDEEEKIRWRVEAEVKLALEKAQRDMAISGGATAEVARLQDLLSAARDKVDTLESDLANWEAAVAARDAELQNLQRALGELSYESEAAERLRGEMRGLQAEMHALRRELDHTKLNSMQLEQAKQQAEAATLEAQHEAAAEREKEEQLQQECINLQRTLHETTRKVQALSMDSGSMIDRRIVVKMMITYFERHHSQEVLDLMTKMLGFNEEEKKLIMASQRQRFGSGPSLASDVAGNGIKGSLADQWIDFLVEQVQAQDNGAAAQPVQEQQQVAPAATFAPTSSVQL